VLGVARGGPPAEGGKQGLDSIGADTTKSADLAVLRDHVAISYGRADLLFANAGIATFAPFAEVTEDAFDRTVATNLKGTFFTVQTRPPVLRDGASVILTSSVEATKGFPRSASTRPGRLRSAPSRGPSPRI
jgi:NAD(P)-dependent dehydrogenase (short-subunit alcohol dehydrogenase family)